MPHSVVGVNPALYITGGPWAGSIHGRTFDNHEVDLDVHRRGRLHRRLPDGEHRGHRCRRGASIEQKTHSSVRSTGTRWPSRTSQRNPNVARRSHLWSFRTSF